VDPPVIDGVIEVVKDHATFREHELSAHASEVVAEVSLALVEGGTERPDHREGEEGVVHLLDAGDAVGVSLAVFLLLAEELS